MVTRQAGSYTSNNEANVDVSLKNNKSLLHKAFGRKWVFYGEGASRR